MSDNRCSDRMHKQIIYTIRCPYCQTEFEVDSSISGYEPFDTECPDCNKEIGSENIIDYWEG